MDTVQLTRLYVLVFIEHRTRRLHIGGITVHPTGDWAVQQARNLALDLGDRSGDFQFLIRDRGSNFTSSFDAIFQAAGVTIVRTAVKAPRCPEQRECVGVVVHRQLSELASVLKESRPPRRSHVGGEFQ